MSSSATLQNTLTLWFASALEYFEHNPTSSTGKTLAVLGRVRKNARASWRRVRTIYLAMDGTAKSGAHQPERDILCR